MLDLPEDSLPVISAQQDLLALRSEIPSSSADLTDPARQTFVGVIDSVEKKGVTLRFIDSLKKLVLVKDLETVQDFLSLYKVGKVVRASKNKLDRLTLKASVIYHQDREQSMLAKDKEAQIKSFFEEVKAQQESYKLQIGEKVEARVSLAKDYGNIVSVEKYPGLTGFILSEHLTNKKEYKEGSKV